MRSAFPGSTNGCMRAAPGACEPLVIGLVNNMGDAALQTTEQQFSDLLGAAGGATYNIRLRLFSFPELRRGEAGHQYVRDRYEPIEELWAADVDALIVTGAEPRTASIPDEAYWPSLTRLVDLARESSTPAVWSCLAAHAAVLYLDGIGRQRLGEKLSGVFRCAKEHDDSLVAGLPASWRVPHSRLNTLDRAQLSGAGYEIVSCSEEAGVDTFMLQRGVPFVFFQGHPEYDPGALFREYRRDVGRFLAGTIDRYPAMPRDYFDDDTARAFGDFRARAEQQREPALLEEFPGCEPSQTAAHSWRDIAVRLYANWLAIVAAGRRHYATTGGSATARQD